jgi:hypothetical protein
MDTEIKLLQKAKELHLHRNDSVQTKTKRN